jgi:hypothetical protein
VLLVTRAEGERVGELRCRNGQITGVAKVVLSLRERCARQR